MNPSSSPGRARRAPAFRLLASAASLTLALACSHSRPADTTTTAARATGSAARANSPAGAPAAAPAAPGSVAPTPTLASPAPSTAAEARVGLRAKDESPKRLAASEAPLSPAPASTAARPSPRRYTAPSSASGLGVGLAGTGSGAGYGSVLRQRRAVFRAQPPEPNTESYASVPENAFLTVAEHPLSTFSSDVDTASFSNARRFLDEGRLPPPDAIRVEEWINYFAYDYAPPDGAAPVAIHTEVSSCPWQPEHRLVRIGIKTRPIEQERVPPRNLVFLIDVSGSMMPPNKLPLLKQGLALLTRTLRPEDRVAMVVYAGSSGLVLPSTSGRDQGTILGALAGLEAGGSTNGGEGIELAYRIAEEHFRRGGINRVVLATDGDFNVGTTSEGELSRLIERKRGTGVFLTVLGFGEGNVKDSTMEMLADKGNGNYAYIDSLAEARKVLVREAGATLVTVAKDVKLQTEWNPARVQSYRLIGYENRVLAAQDFNDDRKDAGDMGAGHAVTALYEVVPVGAPPPAGAAPPVSPLKYQHAPALAAASARDELLTVSVRYKTPTGSTSEKLSATIPDRTVPFASASADQRFAVAVAELAEVLKGSREFGALTLAEVKQTAKQALAGNDSGERPELLALIERAEAIEHAE